MLWVIIGIFLGIWLYKKSPRLQGASGEEAAPSVRATVDGRPVESYVQEDQKQ